MNTRYLSIFAVLFVCMLLIPATLHATGTPAGTVIKNVASATYKDAGGNPMTPVNSDTSYTTVDQLAGIDLSPISYNRVVGDTTVDFALRLTNTGNGSDTYNLTLANQHGWGVAFYLDADSNGAPDNTTPVTITPSIGEDQKYYFVMRLSVPLNTANGTPDTSLVTATSVWGQSHAPSAVAYNHDTITVKRVDLTVKSKTADKSGAQPLDIITYKVKFLNAGGSNAKNVTITDALPTSYLTYNNDAVADSGGPGSFVYNSGTLTWNGFGSVRPSRGVGFHFTATVKSGVVAGDVFSNTAAIAYLDSISGRSHGPDATPPANVTVSDSLGWQLTIDAITNNQFTANHGSDSTNVSVIKWFGIHVINHGNRTDTATIAHPASSIPLTWTIYADLDKNGAVNGADSVCATFASTGPVPQNGGLYYLMSATPANSIVDRTVDSASYTFASASRPSNSKSGYSLLLVKAPKLTLKKYAYSVSVGNHARPGDTLMYVVRYFNQASGTANTIVLADAFPSQVTFLSGTIETSPDSSTWTSRTDNASWNDGVAKSLGVSGGTLTYNIGNVGPGAIISPVDNTSKGFVRFKVRIN